MVLGIAGAMIGGWIGTQLGIGDVTGFNLVSIGLATLGAIILLIIYRLLAK
ncbi:MAG: GlsB/YeaQ/YmgE family stress response membrane protein [Gammaproteobacteria bacterium]